MQTSVLAAKPKIAHPVVVEYSPNKEQLSEYSLYLCNLYLLILYSPLVSIPWESEISLSKTLWGMSHFLKCTCRGEMQGERRLFGGNQNSYWRNARWWVGLKFGIVTTIRHEIWHAINQGIWLAGAGTKHQDSIQQEVFSQYILSALMTSTGGVTH